MNQQIIQRILQEEGGHLISPEEEKLTYPGNRPYPFGHPARIPSVACVGCFRSYQPARTASGDFSQLVVVWFQDNFALPIDPKVWLQLLAIDWDRHAADYDY
jgi:hypothetical protein